jgi:hypothetical protein
VRRAAAGLAAIVALAGCSSEEREEPRTAAEAGKPRAATPRAKPPRPLRCPAGSGNCRAAAGRIVYVERVDPDGDGDLHVVVDAGSHTLAGMTAIDVAPELRPRRDPRVGDRASAAGPLQTGSYGQQQIHALEFHTRG